MPAPSSRAHLGQQTQRARGSWTLVVAIVVPCEIHRAGATRRQEDSCVARVSGGWVAARQLVGEDVVSHVHTSRACGSDHERGSQIGAYGAGQDSKQVHRIVVNLVSGPAASADPHGAEGGAKRARTRCLIVPDIEHKIVFDDVIVSAA